MWGWFSCVSEAIANAIRTCWSQKRGCWVPVHTTHRVTRLPREERRITRKCSREIRTKPVSIAAWRSTSIIGKSTIEQTNKLWSNDCGGTAQEFCSSPHSMGVETSSELSKYKLSRDWEELLLQAEEHGKNEMVAIAQTVNECQRSYCKSPNSRLVKSDSSVKKRQRSSKGE